MVMYVRKLALPLSRSVTTNFISIRKMTATVKSDSAKSLLYKEYGEPADVLHVTTETINQPGTDQVFKLPTNDIVTLNDTPRQ